MTRERKFSGTCGAIKSAHTFEPPNVTSPRLTHMISTVAVTPSPSGTRIVRLIASALPHFRGRDRALLLLARTLGGAWTDRVTFRWPEGPELLLDLNDVGHRSLYFFGQDEPDLTWSIRNILRPGDLFVEAGTSVALYTSLAAARVGPTGRVIGFEPLKTARLRANEQIARNRFENVRIVAVALGDELGEANVYLFDRLPIGHASLRQVSPHAFVADSCPVRRLDSELSADERAKVRLIKLDVEGSELPALKGAEDTLAASRPFVFVECNQTTMAGFGYGAADLIAWLRERDMRCFRWTAGVWLQVDSNRVPAETNLLAVPAKRVAEFAALTAASP